MQRQTSQFITFEGIEGAGKTTAVKFMESWLEQNNIPYILTREPGGTPIAEEIRDILLHHYQEKLTDISELLLFFAGRSQNVQSVILPALAQGQWVICDRFVDASFAYQGGGRRLPLLLLECLEKYVLKDKMPHLTLLLDVPVDVGLSRIQVRQAHDRIEQEKHNFFNDVRQMYLKRAAQCSDRFRIIDANCTLTVLQERLYHVLDDFLNQQEGAS
jgi:dTMP kinase